MKRYVWLVVLGAWTAAGGLCRAQFIADTSRGVAEGAWEAGAAVGLTEVEYDNNDLDDPEVQRTWIGVHGAYGISDRVNAYGVVGLIVKAEPDDWDDSGSGFLLAAGARGTVAELERGAINVYGQLTYLTEDYGEDEVENVKTEGEGSITELAAGATATYEVNDAWTVYGGLELTPFSDGEIEVSQQGGSRDFDIERDSMFALRGGARMRLERFWLRGEIGLLGETAFLFGGGMDF
jgi:hypothetical protein